MKLTKIKGYQEVGYKYDVKETGATLDILTESTIFRPVVIIAVLTIIAGAFGLIMQTHPTLSWASIAYGVVNLILTTYETVVSQQSIVSDQASQVSE